jgi:hypothetical protein
MEVSPMAPYTDLGEWSATSSWSDYSRETFNSSFGSSSSSTSPWQFSTISRKVSIGSSNMMAVGGPEFPQTSMAPGSSCPNNGILYKPLAVHDFLRDSPAMSFEGSTPVTELDASAEDIADPPQTASLALDFSGDENHQISQMSEIMVANIQDQGISYSTARAHEIIDFEYSNSNNLYNPLAGHDFLSARSFDSSTSPMEPDTSAQDLVETYFESCPPLTPASVDIPRAALNSPLTPYSHPTGNLGYIVSPDTSPLGHSVPSSTSPSSATLVQEMSPQKLLERPAILHHVHSSSTRATKEEIQLPQLEVDHVAVGVHKCTIPGCKSERGFKRLEHLKRHQKTHHDKKGLKCRYCQKTLFQVDRSDNYRQHVYLHATPDRKGKRTKFNVKAVAEVAAWEEAKARSRQVKSSSAAKPNSRRNTQN